MAPQLTLYGHIASPYAEKVEIALKEGNIPHKYFSIDLFNKPAFFIEQVNPIGKVPAITYGGPDVPPEKPSPQSFKLAESALILEFLADTYPDAKLLPTDPVQRARVRFFVDVITTKFAPAHTTWLLNSEPEAAESLLKVIEFLQGLLPDDGKYVVGDSYSIADISITPLIHRLYLSTDYDIGMFPAGTGLKLGALLKDPKYAKFVAYASAVTSRAVAKENWDSKKEIVKEMWTKRAAAAGKVTVTA